MTSALDIDLASAPCRCHAAGPSPAAPLAAMLRELADVLRNLTDAQYGLKPVGVIPGSIGGHVRHCLDHVGALLAAMASGRLDYDHRQRDTEIERSQTAAITALEALSEQLDDLSPMDLAAPLQLRVMMTAEGEALDLASSVGRELAYVFSHTIHHNAIVGAMVKTLGGSTPSRFGYAPSTIRYSSRLRSC